MRSVPLRVRVTLLVLGAALLTGLLVVLSGGVESVEDSFVRETLESTEGELDGAVGVDVDTSFDEVAVVFGALLLVGLTALTWFVLGKALSPVEAIADQVDRIGAGNLDQRVPVPEADDELRRLAETMNRMLDRLEQSDDSQRRFVSDASHELRSPITAIRATMEVAAANPDDADWQHTAEVVQEENDRLAALVDDLLLLARMDEQSAGGSISRMEEVDLEEICLEEAARPRPVEVSVRVVTPARVAGSAKMLTRAVRNLVDNAAAHAVANVWLEIEQTETAAHVRVRDDGPGVAPEVAEQIFERFVRVDESRVRDGTGGAGLGLAIARHIAEIHGGQLVLEPSDGAGACFVMTLPTSSSRDD